MSEDRPEIPQNEYEKPVGKGGDLPPLELMPTREWLTARILEVEYRVVLFNNQIQYVCTEDPETKEQVPVIDDETGEKISRKEFAITFDMDNYTLPNSSKPRKVWLQMGASLGEKAHLPTFIFNTLGHDADVETPKAIIEALTGLPVKLQLKNKARKDTTKPPYQMVIYDAVEVIGNGQKPEPVEPPVAPMNEAEVEPEKADDPLGECKCAEIDRVENPDNNQECKTCGKMIVRWDE